MTIAYAPDEEERKIRKMKLKKIRKAENWKRRRALYGVGEVFKWSTKDKGGIRA